VLRNPEKGSYCMIEVAKASINSFASGKADFVQPSDQLITLTLGQLKDLIQEATERAIVPLVARLDALERGVGCREGGEVSQDDRKGLDQILQVVRDLQARNDALKRELEAFQEHVAQERAFDRQRIAKLEHKEPGKTVLSRVEKIEKYLAARQDHRATFEVLKGHLGVNNVLLGDAIEALMSASPGRYTVGRIQGDRRKRVLIMLPKY
jgi:hypothetical protein